MQFFGNNNDPMAQTLKALEEHQGESKLGNAGDFFTSTHERDPHIKKVKNDKNAPVEFNAALLELNASDVMLKYIHLKNKIISGDCIAMNETISVDKEDGATQVFIQWLQPTGMFESGTANPVVTAAAVNNAAPPVVDPTPEEEDAVDDTKPGRKFKGKGSRKKNTKVRL